MPQHYDWIVGDLIEGGDLTADEVFFRGGDSGVLLRAYRQPDLSAFSPDEIAMMRRVAKDLGRKTSRQLSQRSHSEKAWIDTPKGQMIPYDLAGGLSL